MRLSKNKQKTYTSLNFHKAESLERGTSSDGPGSNKRVFTPQKSQKIKSNFENEFGKDVLNRIMNLADEINSNRPKDARIRLRKLVKTMEKNTILTSKIETEILYIFPELKQLEERKFKHTFRVVSWFLRLINKDYKCFVTEIVESEKPYMNISVQVDYCRYLEKICGIYHNMTDEEKEAFISTLLLHDIGNLINPLKHPEIGAVLVECILKYLHFSSDLVNRSKGVVFGHVVPGTLDYGLDNPHSLLNVIENVSEDNVVQEKCLEWLILLASMDIAGWSLEGKNNLVISKLENFVNYLDKDYIVQLDTSGEFYKYVLKMISRRSLNARVVPEDSEEVVRCVDELVSGEEMEFFKDILNKGIRLSGIYQIIYGLSAHKSFRNLVKLIRFFTQIIQLSIEDSQRKTIVAIASVPYVIPKEKVETIVEKLIECLEKVPDRMSKAKVKEELNKNEWRSFFSIPITTESNVLLFDINKLLEKSYVSQKTGMEPLLPQWGELYWKDMPKGWEASPSTHKAYSVILRDEEKILEVIQKLIEDKKEDEFVVSELGCGRGRLFSKIIRIPEVDKVCGLDINKDALNILERRIKNLPQKNKAKVVCEDFYEPKSYNQLPQSDVIIAYDVLMHLRNLNQAFEIISQKLKPNGIFIGNLSVKENVWRNRIRQYGLFVGILKAWGEVVLLPFLLRMRIEKLERYLGRRGFLRTHFCTYDEARAMLSKYFELISLKTDYYHFFIAKK